MPEQYELRRNSIALYIVTELSADDDTNGFLGKSIYFGSEVNQNEVDIIASIGGNKTAFVFVDTVNQEEIRNKIKCLCQLKSLAFGPRKVVHLPRPERF